MTPLAERRGERSRASALLQLIDNVCRVNDPTQVSLEILEGRLQLGLDLGGSLWSSNPQCQSQASDI
jgi:hypothetical protein